ncbi:hypothetical protein Y032_0237g3254 [Ancylostoma ceylanicum]|uniref:Uncharacterized protein n=1 Tax=Ancylostoma ceylanicum TaxID=53326 RepID=A0A016SFF0_9BILA|nr:hypothetical protein Y032_0237g3254 [Ancylostoma ceylanicum]
MTVASCDKMDTDFVISTTSNPLWNIRFSTLRESARLSLSGVAKHCLLDHRRRAAGERAILASQLGLESVSTVIDSCINHSVAPGTLEIYMRIASLIIGGEQREKQQFWLLNWA